MKATTNPPSIRPFQHEALVYRTPAAYLEGCVPFVRAGIALGAPVLVAVPGENVQLLRTALDGDVDEVAFVDMTEAGRNPGRIIPAVLHSFVQQHSPKPVRVIGEPIWAGRSAAEYPACVQHEALINLAFADADAIILCPYDAGRLAPGVLADAERTHPVITIGRQRQPSAGYAEPDEVFAAFNRPLPKPPVPPATLLFDHGELAAVRRFVAEHVGGAGLDPDRVGDLGLAVNEVATNAIMYGSGPGTLRIWSEAGHVVCEVSAAGQLADPLVGRIPPDAGSERGRGLLLVNYLCDLVQTHTDRTGTTIRLHMRV